MQATIAHYRRGRKTQRTNQMILYVSGVDTKEKAEGLIGKKVSWTAPGKNKTTITGKISAPHGRKGAVRAIFERGMPGQAIGKKVMVE